MPWTDQFEIWVILAIVLPPYLITIIIAYYHAESIGENGFFWAFFVGLLPVLGFILYIAWVLVQRVRNRQPSRWSAPGVESPDIALSRQRLRGRGLAVGSKNIEIEDLIQQGRWNDAGEKAKLLLEEAEEAQDGATIASMIGYLDRIKKGKRGK